MRLFAIRHAEDPHPDIMLHLNRVALLLHDAGELEDVGMSCHPRFKLAILPG